MRTAPSGHVPVRTPPRTLRLARDGLLVAAVAALGAATPSRGDGVVSAGAPAGAEARGPAREGSPGVAAAQDTVAPSPPADTLERMAADATEAAVLLDVETGSGSRQGSGFLVEPDGTIVTNYHVVDGARAVRVRLASGDVYERVKILATDERRDLAVVQVPGFGLPTLPLGNSDSVRVGASVIAIGSPLGLENTVSTGIVSGRRREPEGYELLQISAPASRGSSGGAVISESGEVVGVAASQMEGGQNLNFAVPINYARGLLSHVDGEPLAVFSPDSRTGSEPSSDMSSDASGAGRPLGYDLDDFHGFRIEWEGRAGEDRRRRSRIIYRRIEAVGGRPRIERWAEVEVTESTGPFGTPQTVRRERSRAVVEAVDLRPVSVRGEAGWWDGDDWRRKEYEFRFEGPQVTGTITDSAGHVREISRDLPGGSVLRSTRHLAFATLAEDSLVGRSVELTTFDAPSGEVRNDRYDVRDTTTIEVDGEEFDALRVNLASGLENATAFFRRAPPRVLLRLVKGYGQMHEEMAELEMFEQARSDSRPDSDGGGGGERPDGWEEFRSERDRPGRNARIPTADACPYRGRNMCNRLRDSHLDGLGASGTSVAPVGRAQAPAIGRWPSDVEPRRR